jgi:hypothetical protein
MDPGERGCPPKKMTCSLTIADLEFPSTPLPYLLLRIPPQHHQIAIMKAYWYDNVEVSAPPSLPPRTPLTTHRATNAFPTTAGAPSHPPTSPTSASSATTIPPWTRLTTSPPPATTRTATKSPFRPPHCPTTRKRSKYSSTSIFTKTRKSDISSMVLVTLTLEVRVMIGFV